MHKDGLTLSVPARLIYLDTVLSFVSEAARVFGAREDDIKKIQLGVEEAVTNVIEALANAVDDHFSISCRSHLAAVEIRIREKGLPFDPNNMVDFSPEKLLTQQDTAGLGLYLLRQVMDEVRFVNLGRKGKETILVKHLENQRINNLTTALDDHEETAAANATDFHSIRPFRPDDAIEISRCAYQAYGYSYEPYIYYPEMIREMNKAGVLHSFVAVDSQDRAIGHIGIKLYQSGNHIGELGVAFVQPRFRRYGIFARLLDYVDLQAAKQTALYGLYCRAVTSHVVSQKKALDYAFVSTGIMLGLFPSDVNFRELGGKIVQKESGLVMYQNLHPQPPRVVYMPPQHQAMVSEIFERACCPVIQTDHKEASLPGIIEHPHTLQHSRMDVFNSADILCYKYDEAVSAEIHSVTRDLCLEHVDVIYLYLNLEDPDLVDIYSACEQMGYFFAGVLPYFLAGSHALILQYLNNLNIDFDQINLQDPFACEIRTYIQSCRP